MMVGEERATSMVKQAMCAALDYDYPMWIRVTEQGESVQETQIAHSEERETSPPSFTARQLDTISG